MITALAFASPLVAWMSGVGLGYALCLLWRAWEVGDE